MERGSQIIERKTYALSFHEVRQAIHEWLEENHNVSVPIGVDLTVGQEGALLVWDCPRSDT